MKIQKLHVYVAYVSINDLPSVQFCTSIDKGSKPSDWVYIETVDFEYNKCDEELVFAFKEYKKTLMTPEQKIAELEAKLAKYEAKQPLIQANLQDYKTDSLE